MTLLLDHMLFSNQSQFIVYTYQKSSRRYDEKSRNMSDKADLRRILCLIQAIKKVETLYDLTKKHSKIIPISEPFK